MFKPNICPTVIDQVTFKKPFIKTLKSGERVIVDPETTIQRLTLTFYGRLYFVLHCLLANMIEALVNVGAFFGIATT